MLRDLSCLSWTILWVDSLLKITLNKLKPLKLSRMLQKAAHLNNIANLSK